MLAHKLRRASGGGVADKAIVDSAVDGTATSAFTFNSVALGPAYSGRIIVVGAYGRGVAGNSRTISSMTLDGNTMSAAGQGAANPGCVGQAYRLHEAGETGDIVVTFNSTVNGCGIVVWALANVDATPHDEAHSTNPSGSIDVPAGGIALGVFGNRNGTTANWTGLTSDALSAAYGINDSRVSGASDLFAAEALAHAVSVSSDSTLDDSLSLTSWAPL